MATTLSSSVLYNGGDLSCINATTNLGLNSVLSKINQKICTLSGATGTVTSVGISSAQFTVTNSPITNSGTIFLTLKDAAVTYAKIQDVSGQRLLGRYFSGSGDTQEISIGSGLSLSTSTGVLSATNASSGTVSSVAVSSSDLSVVEVQSLPLVQ